MIVLDLLWPSADLSPNGRVHYMAFARAKKAAKNYAWGMTKSAMGPLGIAYGSWIGPVDVHLEFIPAVDRNRDEDNFVAAMKASLDGIASALGVDDSNFRLTHAFLPKEAKARVRVTLIPSEVKVEMRGQING